MKIYFNYSFVLILNFVEHFVNDIVAAVVQSVRNVLLNHGQVTQNSDVMESTLNQLQDQHRHMGYDEGANTFSQSSSVATTYFDSEASTASSINLSAFYLDAVWMNRNNRLDSGSASSDATEGVMSAQSGQHEVVHVQPGSSMPAAMFNQGMVPRVTYSTPIPSREQFVDPHPVWESYQENEPIAGLGYVSPPPIPPRRQPRHQPRRSPNPFRGGIIDDHFRCVICMESLMNREPYAMPCGHVVCHSDLLQWLSGNHTSICPCCREGISYAECIRLYII